MKYNVTLIVDNLRGSSENSYTGDFEPDLKVIYMISGDKALVIPGSSIKGVIKKNALMICKSQDPIVEIFGLPGTRQGKVEFGWGYVASAKPNKRYGVKVDQKLGIVKTAHLYSFEYLPGNLSLKFETREIYPLSQNSRKILKNSIKLLKYTSIGWGGSKGLGIVKEVEIQEG